MSGLWQYREPSEDGEVTLTRVNDFGYVERRTVKGSGRYTVFTDFRDWWLIKYQGSDRNKSLGVLSLGNIILPARYVGKKVKVKIEVID